MSMRSCAITAACCGWALLAGLPGAPAQAQPQPQPQPQPQITAPEAVGLSAQRLQRVDAFIARLQAEGKLAGAVTVVARHGLLVSMTAHGFADLATRRVMRPDDIFQIQSMSKPVGVVALRGCPMCWTIGLVQTLTRQRFRRVCTEEGCRLDASRPIPTEAADTL